ncbi:MAG: phage tail assembly chaperone G [Sarcina sp.]
MKIIVNGKEFRTEKIMASSIIKSEKVLEVMNKFANKSDEEVQKELIKEGGMGQMLVTMADFIVSVFDNKFTTDDIINQFELGDIFMLCTESNRAVSERNEKSISKYKNLAEQL